MASSDPNLPPDLRSALKRSQRSAAVPPELDRLILSENWESVSRRRRFRVGVRWAGGIAAALAASVVVVFLLIPADRQRSRIAQSGGADSVARQSEPTTAPKREDPKVEAVTILDAMALAQQIRDTLPANRPSEWDINQDNVVDQRDAEAIALTAVALEGREVP